MKSVRFQFAAIASLLLCACATPVSRDLAFSPASPNAVLVVLSPMQVMGTVTEFRRVDIERQRFEEEIVDVITAGLGTSHVINYSTETGLWLSMREVQPGDYALVSMTVNTYNGYASGQSWICVHGPVPVYRLEPGQISIVSTYSWWPALSGAGGSEPTSENVLAEFERARVRYPGLSGVAHFPRPQALIGWPETRPNFMESMNRNCAEPEGFTLAPMPVPQALPVAKQP